MSNDYTDNPGSPKKHKKRLHISFLSISPVISIVIIAALVIALIYTKKTASVSYQTDGKVTQLGFENIGELATQSVTTTSVRVETKDRKLFDISIPFTESKYIYTYNTNIKAGINFSDVVWNFGVQKILRILYMCRFQKLKHFPVSLTWTHLKCFMRAQAYLHLLHL